MNRNIYLLFTVYHKYKSKMNSVTHININDLLNIVIIYLLNSYENL